MISRLGFGTGGYGALAAAAVLVACAGTPSVPEPPAVEAPSPRPEVVQGPSRPATLPGREPEDLLAPGDLLNITIHGYPDLTRQVRIPPSGVVDLPLLGAVKARGLNVPEFIRDLRTAYEKDYLTTADVSVSVVDFAPRKVYILGSVKREGDYGIPTGGRLTLLQLLSRAGGFTETADQSNLVVLRGRGEGERVERVRYGDLVPREGAATRPLFLYPDDTVLVGKEQRVYVLGRVNSPGAFPIGEGGLTVIQAVSLAGGFERIASREGTIVIREPAGGKRQTFRVPVKSIVSDETRQDFSLQPGDIVYVPEGLF